MRQKFIIPIFSLCADVTPPELSCPSDVTVPALPGLHFAEVAVPMPRATGEYTLRFACRFLFHLPFRYYVVIYEWIEISSQKKVDSQYSMDDFL